MEFVVKNFEVLSTDAAHIQELKDLVLDMAMRGQLVPQYPEDEPSGALLAKFAEEINDLATGKLIRKRKKYPPLSKEEIPFEIPTNWKWCRLSEICYDHGQKKPDKKFCYVDVGSIDNEKGEVSDDYKILTPNEAPSRARKIVKNGTVIYSTVRPYLLNIAVVTKDFPFEPIVSTAFAILHPCTGLDERFLFLYLRSQAFIKYVESQMVGVAYPAINDKSFFSGPFPLPPTEEQRCIVQKVNQLFRQIDALAAGAEQAEGVRRRLRAALLHRLEQAPGRAAAGRAWAQLEEQFGLAIRRVADVQALRQRILQLAVKGLLVEQDPADEPASVLLERIKEEKGRLVEEGKIRKQKALPAVKEEEMPFEVPEGWVWCRLGTVIELISGQHIVNSDYNTNERGIPYLTGPSDFGELNPIFSRWTEKPKVTANSSDILITVKGSGVGKINVLHEDNVAIGRQLMAIRQSILPQKYLLLFLRTKYQQLQATKIGIAIPGISREDILEMKFPLPPLAEQRRIVERVEGLLGWCERLEAAMGEMEGRLVRAALNHKTRLDKMTILNR